MRGVHISSVMYTSAGLLFLTRRVTGDKNNKNTSNEVHGFVQKAASIVITTDFRSKKSLTYLPTLRRTARAARGNMQESRER